MLRIPKKYNNIFKKEVTVSLQRFTQSSELSKSKSRGMDEETLNKLAAEALVQEAKLGAKRAEVMGPSGWIKPKQTINKRFLHSTLRNAVLSNKHRLSKKDNIFDDYGKGDNSSDRK